MSRIYTCTACENGDHERCEIGYGQPNTFGGGHCICRCRGRSYDKWMKEEEEERLKRMKEICSFERKERLKNHPPIQIGNTR